MKKTFVSVIMLIFMGNIALGDTGELQIIVSPDKGDYRVGEPIYLSIRIKNVGRKSITIDGPGYGNITVGAVGHWGRHTRGSVGPKTDLAPGQTTEAFIYPLISNQVNDLLLPNGKHILTINYDDRCSIEIPVNIYHESSDGEKKFDEWHRWRFSDRDERFAIAKSYVDQHRLDDDFISYHMLVVYLSDAVLNAKEHDEGFWQEIISSSMWKYSGRREVVSLAAEHMKRKGDLIGAVRRIASVDLARAVDWIEDYAGSRSKFSPSEMLEVIRVTEELEFIAPPRVRDRIRAVRAQALLIGGQKRQAIEMIRPINPSDAERWESEY